MHLSRDVVNELCSIVGETVLRRVLHEFNTSRGIRKYTVLADETRDTSGAEQMSVCMEWVDRSLCIHEDLLALYSLSMHGQTAEVLTKCFKDVLTRCQ